MLYKILDAASEINEIAHDTPASDAINILPSIPFNFNEKFIMIVCWKMKTNEKGLIDDWRAEHMEGFSGFLEEILIKEEGWWCAAKTNTDNYTEFED